SADVITQELRTFVREHFDSVEQLELLLILRADPARSWSREEMAERLRSHVDSVEFRLLKLERSGLATRDPEGRFLFRASSPDKERIVSALALAYVDRRYTLINLIYDGSRDMVRG